MWLWLRDILVGKQNKTERKIIKKHLTLPLLIWKERNTILQKKKTNKLPPLTSRLGMEALFPPFPSPWRFF